MASVPANRLSAGQYASAILYAGTNNPGDANPLFDFLVVMKNINLRCSVSTFNNRTVWEQNRYPVPEEYAYYIDVNYANDFTFTYVNGMELFQSLGAGFFWIYIQQNITAPIYRARVIMANYEDSSNEEDFQMTKETFEVQGGWTLVNSIPAA